MNSRISANCTLVGVGVSCGWRCELRVRVRVRVRVLISYYHLKVNNLCLTNVHKSNACLPTQKTLAEKLARVETCSNQHVCQLLM